MLTPLVELDESELYKLLGDAWYAQLRVQHGEIYSFELPEKIGKREYQTLLARLREDLRLLCDGGPVARAVKTIQRSAQWRMPATVVAALAVKQGLVEEGLVEVGLVEVGMAA